MQGSELTLWILDPEVGVHVEELNAVSVCKTRSLELTAQVLELMIQSTKFGDQFLKFMTQNPMMGNFHSAV